MSANALCVALLVGLGWWPGALRAQTSTERITAGGRDREYRLRIPRRPAPAPGYPVVLVFHGGGGNARQIERATGFSALADREGVVVVYPQGIGDQWNDERTVPGSRAHEEHVDDVGFVGTLLGALRRRLTIDSTRIFATGISNGGFISNLIAERLPRRIAAIAPVAGGIGDAVAAAFHAEPGVSVLLLQGTEDPLVPYGGGGVSRGRRGSTVSSDSVVRLWNAANGISGPPARSTLPDRDPRDGCRADVERWTGGVGGTEVIRYRLVGGGHTWPGGAQYLPRRLVGVVCRDFDATDEIWRFFAEHPQQR